MKDLMQMIITLSKNQFYKRKNQMSNAFIFGNELDINSCSYFFCMFDVRINPDLDLNDYIFPVMVLLKEMRTRCQPKISSCCFCVSCKSRVLEGRVSPRFPCVTTVMEGSPQTFHEL